MRDKKNRGQSKELLRTKASKCEEEIWCVYVRVTRVLRSASPFPIPRRIFNPYYFIDDAIAFVIHKLLLIPLRDDDFENWWFSSLVRRFYWKRKNRHKNHYLWLLIYQIDFYDFKVQWNYFGIVWLEILMTFYVSFPVYGVQKHKNRANGKLQNPAAMFLHGSL